MKKENRQLSADWILHRDMSIVTLKTHFKTTEDKAILVLQTFCFSNNNNKRYKCVKCLLVLLETRLPLVQIIFKALFFILTQ